MLKKMRAAEFHQWAEPILRYLPEGGTWWRGRYSHFRFVDQWFVAVIYVFPKRAECFEVLAKVIFLGAYDASVSHDFDALFTSDEGPYPWRLIPTSDTERYLVPSDLPWDAGQPGFRRMTPAEYGDDPVKVFEDFVIFGVHASAKEMRDRYRRRVTVELSSYADLPDDYVDLNLAILDGIDGDFSSLPAAVDGMLRSRAQMHPDAWHEGWDLWDARIEQLRNFVEHDGSQREFENIVGGWVQHWRDEWMQFYKPKPVLGASIPFEDKSMLPWAFRDEQGRECELREHGYGYLR